MADDAAKRPRERWRALVLSVRGLLILTAILGLFLARLANRAETQRRAVELLDECDGRALYDYQRDPPPMGDGSEEAPTPLREWLRDSIGEDYFHSITEVCFLDGGLNLGTHPPIPDEAIRSLGVFNRLVRLSIEDRALTDEQLAMIGGLGSLRSLEVAMCEGFQGRGVAQLGRLRNLQQLLLMGCDIDDEDLASFGRLRDLERLTLMIESRLDGSGLRHLRDLTRLRNLNLYAHNLTDRGLEEVGRLGPLQALTIHAGPNITDEGLRAIANLEGLERLNLVGCEDVSDEGIAQLRRLKHLQVLRLDRIPINGTAFRSMAGMESLAHLFVYNTPISEEGLEAIASIPSLKTLRVGEFGATEEAIARFERERPDLAVKGWHGAEVIACGGSGPSAPIPAGGTSPWLWLATFGSLPVIAAVGFRVLRTVRRGGGDVEPHANEAA